jgi:hypothetical protein
VAKFKPTRAKAAKPKKRKRPRARKATSGGKKTSTAWRQYVGGISNAPLPD